MFRAVLFDFDGTLADSYGAIAASANHVRALRGLPPLSIDEIRGLVGLGLEQLMEDIVPDTDPYESARLYREHHPSVMHSHTQLLPGVGETLAFLNDRGIRMGICSNKPAAITRALVDSLGLNALFDAVLGPEDSGEPKPHPKMLHMALEKTGCPVSRGLYIGDMIVDIQAARNAGLPVWVVPTGSNDVGVLELAKPDRILKRMDDVINLMGNPPA